MSWFSIFDRTSVEPGHAVLEYREGRPARVILAGTYVRRADALYVVVDMRERTMTVASQEIMTADAVSVRASLTMRVVVVDAVVFTERTVDPMAAVYLASQTALRDLCGSMRSAELADDSALDTEAIRVAAARAADAVGLDVLDVAVRDMSVAGESRPAPLEMITARAHGLVESEAPVEPMRGTTPSTR
ncbi:SPFH domain-containing protein [Gordonia sp. CPCC 206044]|uniref:SPFH domain-containing protein n=1 Tax=Gordonia sp. CPCC 206044 TaxID=3140793 RepID=UPI003AF3E957